MKKDPKIFLQHILESIKQVEQYTGGITREEFFKLIQVQDAVIRRLEIIGEATKHLTEELKKSYPEISWHKPLAMRNILIHEYFGIDLSTVWVTATEILPEFKKQIKDLFKMLK